MASVIEVFGADGTLQSVSLHAQVRADEVVHAIARRRGTAPEHVSLFTLHQVVAWREAWAAKDAAFFPADAVKARVELKKLAPDDRPLKVRAQCEARVKEATRALEDSARDKGMQVAVRATVAFAFLDAAGEALFRDNFEDIMSRGNSRASGGGGGGGGGQGGGGADHASRLSSDANSHQSRPTSPAARSTASGDDERSVTSDGGGGGGGGGVEFAPINPIGRGEKCGFLFQRSAANPREWQRRWCVLRKAELVHALNSSGSAVDAKTVRLNQNRVKAISPASLGGLKHCFEIDTPFDVLQFRAKTEEEAKGWIDAITEKVTLASENEKFHLAERMVEDGQRAAGSRDEALLDVAMSSLRGLLSSHAGADRLYRFAKRASLGKRGERNGELVAFYLDLERAHAAFSTMPGADPSDPGQARRGSAAANGSSEVFAPQGSSPQYRYSSSLSSLASSSGSSVTGATLRGSAAALSRKEWMIQICERVLTLFEQPVRSDHATASATASTTAPDNLPDAGTDDEDGASAGADADADADERATQLAAVLRAADKLRIELLDENLQFIPRESCIIVIEEARHVVRHSIETGLYQDFVASSDYERILASIPSRVRSR